MDILFWLAVMVIEITIIIKYMKLAYTRLEDMENTAEVIKLVINTFIEFWFSNLGFAVIAVAVYIILYIGGFVGYGNLL